MGRNLRQLNNGYLGKHSGKYIYQLAKHINGPHYQVTIPNEMHQFDLLYMPSDTLYGNKYKYIPARINATSRYKVARPLRMKQVRDMAEMIIDIYKVGPLTHPKIFKCDNGSEFKGEVAKMLEKHEVKIQRVTTKYKHTHTSFVEAPNKILAERLFKVQGAQELNDGPSGPMVSGLHPEQVSSRWVKHLYGLADELNDTQTGMIGMKPSDAIKMNEVPLVNQENYPPEEKLPEDGLYHYLLQSGEEHDDRQHRATVEYGQKEPTDCKKMVEDAGTHVMYYLAGPEGTPHGGNGPK